MAAVVESLAPAGGYPVPSSSAESSAPVSTTTGTAYKGSGVPVRPALIRGATDQILSYYQSEHAGKAQYQDHNSPSRRTSSSSRSSSEYSSESLDCGRFETQTGTSPSQALPSAAQSLHVRRSSVPTQESTDRRRLAIVELDNSPRSSETDKGSGRVGYSGVSASSALLSRRGLHVSGLALVAPPDASPATYTDLTPPPTAPVVVGDRLPNIAPPASSVHSRSASEIVTNWSHLRYRSSRDVGIVGIGVIPVIAETAASSSSPHYNDHHTQLTTPGLKVPIFQTPSKSRSPSPANTPGLSECTSMTDSLLASPANLGADVNRADASTPAIGEGKDIEQPVIGPIVVGLNSANVMRREPMKPMDTNNTPITASSPVNLSSSYSKAGPLPPLPKPMFDIDIPGPISVIPPPRPPRSRTLMMAPSIASPPPARDIEVLKESLQLPQSVSNVLTSRSPSRPELKRANTDGSQLSAKSEDTGITIVSDSAVDAKRSKSIHRREGAFPPSAPNTSNSTPQDSPVVNSACDVPTLQRIHNEEDASAERIASPEPRLSEMNESDRRSGLELKRENSWISLGRHAPSSPNGKALSLRESPEASPSASPMPLPSSRTGRGAVEEEIRFPLNANASSNPFKSTINNLKRFSALPRTPSSLSMRSSSQMFETPSSSRTPSPATPRPSQRQKVINAWPEAMQFREISAMKSPSERALAYTQKIQELSMYDTGLSEWMRAMQTRGNRSTRNSAAQLTSAPSLPSDRQNLTQPRHTSHGSVDSEATFPVRPDAYRATDLTMRPSDDLSVTKIPPSALPYPSLAVIPPPRVATLLSPTSRSYQIPLSNGSRSGTGFFASIGRKASIRKDRSADSPPSPARVLTKRSPHTSPPSRSNEVQISSTPTIPGGPRAPPGRMQRSQTVSVSPRPAVMESPPVTVTRSDTRTSLASRRPSLFNRSAGISPPQPPSGAEFEQQVDKLADLLPHAERTVLAGYLRRAGQDILAIGQYLEDEKKGNIRYD